MSYRFPDGIYFTKKEYLEAYKEINNIEYIEEDVFLDCLVTEYHGHQGERPKFYWNTQKVQPKQRKKSRIRDALTVFMTWFVKTTDWFMK